MLSATASANRGTLRKNDCRPKVFLRCKRVQWTAMENLSLINAANSNSNSSRSRFIVIVVIVNTRGSPGLLRLTRNQLLAATNNSNSNLISRSGGASGEVVHKEMAIGCSGGGFWGFLASCVSFRGVGGRRGRKDDCSWGWLGVEYFLSLLPRNRVAVSVRTMGWSVL